MRLAFVVAIASGIVAIALIAMLASALPTKDYELSVDALMYVQNVEQCSIEITTPYPRNQAQYL